MSVCWCTAYEVCFPCRDRQERQFEEDARTKSFDPPGISGLLERQREIELGYQGLVAGASQAPAEAPDVEPATDEDIATYEAMAARGALLDPEAARELIARVRQAESEADSLRDQFVTLATQRMDVRCRAEEAEAEAARLREQVAAMQAADAGAFW